MFVLKTSSRERIDELTFSPDSRRLVTPAHAKGAGVNVWDSPVSVSRPRLIPVPIRSVIRVAFNPADANQLYAGNDELCAIEIAEGECEPFPNIPRWAGLWFGVSSDGTRLAVFERTREGPGRLSVFAGSDHARPKITIDTTRLPWSPVCFLPDGERFVGIEFERNSGSRIVIRSAGSGEVVWESGKLTDPPEHLALSPDGTSLACQTRDMIFVHTVGGDIASAPTLRNDTRKHFTGVAFHPSGKWLAVTSNDATVKFYDTETWAVAKAYTWDVGRLRSVAFSPDGTLAAAGADAGKIVVWDVDA